jgi:chromosome segregation ATPase
MGNLSGFGLTGRLIAKHFGKLGDSIAESIASFDPETATEADRDRLQATLQQSAIKMAAARQEYQKDQDAVAALQKQIDSDTAASEKIIARFNAGAIDKETLDMFCDELEAAKGRLPSDIQDAANAKAYMDELQKIVDALSKSLADFDARAKQAIQTLKSAEAQKDLQTMRQAQQAELTDLRNVSGHSSALDALTKKAGRVSTEAEGMKIVADINQAPIDRADKLNSLRASLGEDSHAGESTVDRLRRLTGGGADKTAA